ncbi:MAG: nascent polypeptide-associated complex protein [Candidatus Thermoplasmatota archaeon]|uniref:Nascent polypeptide-associated complex protein n=2 Tax=Cuniculiplasma divulgatum TaxID=1673428 RepID=A0A1N5SP49_9ARCH|nr:nascent polypeptide-associated complex protein [Candidatus Thermoplasmatota archaeon]SIM37671.1 nascent polypeptide-associated complex protein [Cuniculiplasma divulgatum]
MIPGKMNSREVKRMMQQMGIKQVEYPDVKRVVMEAGEKNYIIENPQVVAIEAQGQKSFQITGTLKEVIGKKKEVAKEGTEFPEDDIKLVMEQASVSREKAIDALKKAEGQPADAIMNLMSN